MTVQQTKLMVLVSLTILLFILPGCSGDKQEEVAEKPATSQKSIQPQVEMTSIKGKVVEVVAADNFIFILLDRDEQQIWATVPAVEVKVGEEVTLLNANVFSRFYSKSLKRSFDELIFASGIEGKSAGTRVATVSPK